MTPRPHFRRFVLLFALASALLVSLASGVAASETRTFRVADRDAALAGELEGVAVDGRGVLLLAHDLEQLTSFDVPYIFDAAPLGAEARPNGADGGWLLGTGADGGVFEVAGDGTTRRLVDLEEPQVFAVHADAQGRRWAGGSPGGRLYSLDETETRDPVETGATYIWDLAHDADGTLLIATGLPGRLLRLARSGSVEPLVEEPVDAHVRTLLVRSDGSVWLGTAGQGLILRLDRSGELQTLYDAPSPEIAAFTEGEDGVVYAAVLASEASLVDLGTPAAGGEAATSGDATAASAGGAVTASATGEVTIGSRGGGQQGPRSEIVRLWPDGRVETVLAFADETVHSILWRDGSLWVGTGFEGRLYRWDDDSGLTREAALEERQIVALVEHPRAGTAVVTTSGASVYRLDSGLAESGEYRSAVLDAGSVARFGALRWRGPLPEGASVQIAARTGMSAVPDATWSPWMDLESTSDPRQVSLAGLPEGQFVQWRARFERSGREPRRVSSRGEAASRQIGPRMVDPQLTYRQENLEPVLTTLEVLAPGEILVPQSFNPSTTVFEPWSPNRDGIFTTLGEGEGTEASNNTKSLYKQGWRTLRWNAVDPNGDALRYALEVRRETETGDAGPWLPMVPDLDRTWYSFDASVLPDGQWRFRVAASDAALLAPGEGKETSRESEPVTIDHAPPRLVSASRGGGRLTAEIRDALQSLRRVEISIDAGPWRPVAIADGLLDGQSERVSAAVPDDARLVLLRAADAAWNVVTFDVSSR